ncbi:S1/P1 nuclease [Arenibacter sp. GZD96]|uniref:S1/P1 nuclease n=1 Tax=Aurantibrevibacter litoralis TaxID=3106030 RepID=UPI002AFEE69A|nr:S1/P1 nuclease [Arenibacter sp. GZD-96]MEA1787538.1 S1/P1 nuclease [Arenibacter sp. GZD-96]
MKKIVLLVLLTVQFALGNDLYWSKTGHRVVGEVAENHLSKKAKKAIAELLQGQNLASVSNFADEIKADPSFKHFNAWHYVNYPTDKQYSEVSPNPDGDLMIGIQKCIDIIKDPKGKKEDKTFYLKMLVHLVGDLHQPMHVGKLEDKGGNDIQLQWFGRGTNLHRLWDSNMIDDHGMSYTELTGSLPKLSKQEKEAMQQGTMFDWMEESRTMANTLYDSVTVGEKLGYAYGYAHWSTVEVQLQKGGVRLAKILNALFQ